MRRWRLRRLAKWLGVAICAGIAIAWTASLRAHSVVSVQDRGGHSRVAMLRAGMVTLIDMPLDPRIVARYAEVDASRASRGEPPVDLSNFRWNVKSSRLVPPSWRTTWRSSTGFNATVIEISLWLPCLAVGIPTACLFWSDRRARPGHCRCGYSLAGLGEGAACPECGVA